MRRGLDVGRRRTTESRGTISLGATGCDQLPGLGNGINRSFGFNHTLRTSGACNSHGAGGAGFSLDADVPLFAKLQVPGGVTLDGLGLGTTARSLGGTGRSVDVSIASTCLRVLFGRRLTGMTRGRMRLDQRRLRLGRTCFGGKGTSRTRICRTHTHITRSRVSTMRTSGGCRLTLLRLDRLLRLPAPSKFKMMSPHMRSSFALLSLPRSVCTRTILGGPDVGTTRFHLRNTTGGVHVTRDS